MLLANAMRATTGSTLEETRPWPSFLWTARDDDAIAADRELRGRVHALEQQLRELESQNRSLQQYALLGTMTAGVLHDLAAPVACVTGHLEMLTMGPLTASQREDVEAMGRGADRLRALTALLLSFLRRGGGRQRPVRLSDIVARALGVCSYVLARKSIDVAQRVPADLPRVPGDAPLLEGVVINLVDNAVRAMHSGGILRIEGRVASGGVELLISDDGEGIEPERLQKLFRPLTEAQPDGEGHGIGLAFARQVIDQHDGALTAESARGQGTTFCVWLPEAPAEHASPRRGKAG